MVPAVLRQTFRAKAKALAVNINEICFPRQYSMQLAEARKERGDVKPRSPGPTPTAIQARCSAAVPLAQAMQYFAPVISHSRCSKASTTGPVVRKSDLSTEVTAAISSSSTLWQP